MKQKRAKNHINYLSMKTKQVMVRQMGDFKVLQRTDNRMFNATELLKQWNDANGANKEIKDYFANRSTDELVNEMAKDTEILNGGNSPYLKQRGKYNGGTWMHPLLFIDFAMWINPKFKLQVLKFVQDKLIDTRHEAGDQCNVMKQAIAGIITDPSRQYPHIMKALNLIVFGVNDKDLRQAGTSEQLKELATLESFIGDSVACGLIQSFDHLIQVLRNKYRLKHATII